MDITKEEKKAWAALSEKSAVWLNVNFRKFSQSNKIRIALEVFKRRNQPILDKDVEDWVAHPIRLVPATGNGHGKEDALERYKSFIN